MKKDQFLPYAIRKCGLLKLLFIIKFTLLFLVISVGQVFASDTYSQIKKSSLDLKKTSIEEVLTKIEDNTQTNAQQITVKGNITDANSGEPLVGVNIVVEGTEIGAISDLSGQYSIQVPDQNSVLVFSYIGYLSTKVSVSGRSEIDITLLLDVEGLDEVVVVGYGTKSKATLTGSVAVVKGDDLIRSQSINVSNSIAGKLSGVISVTRSGEPGSDGSVLRVRGENTLNNNDALIVVDGVPGRSLDRIDPNSIETISVLKDASAAIYGSQAANGVILITTKRGKTGKPQIIVNANQGFSQPTRTPNLLNAADYATSINEVEEYAKRTPRYSDDDIQKFKDGSDPWGHPNTDWFSSTYKSWSKQSMFNMNLSGGSETFRYFVSMGTKYQDAYYKNSATNYNQYDFRSNLDADINKYISVGFDVSGRMEDRNYPTRSSGDILWMLVRGKPTEPAYWPDGKAGPDIEFGNNPVVISTSQTGYNRNKGYSLNSNFKLNIKVPWIKGLTMAGNAAIDKNFNFSKTFIKPWYLYQWDKLTYDVNNIPVLTKAKRGVDQASLNESMADNQNLLLYGLISYEKTIAENHHLSVMAGSESRVAKGDYFSAYRGYFESTVLEQLDAGGITGITNGGNAYNQPRLHYFGRLNYNFKDKYLAEFVWRVDGSYIFPEDNRFGFFPGVSLGWRMSEEKFWKDKISFIQGFKLRASYGQTGNDRIEEWRYLTSYAFGDRNSSFITNINQENKILYENGIPNPNVTWEVANQGDIGFDALLLKNKLSITFDYFDYRRSNILWNRNLSVPLTTGLVLPPENIGKVANRGFDFEVSYKDNAGDFKYEVSVTGGLAKNKILFWDEVPGRPDYQTSTGHPMPTDPNYPDNNLFYQVTGVYKDSAQVANSFHWAGARPGDLIFKDVNKDSIIDGNDRVRSYKNDLPTLQGGLSFRFQYKQFDLSILFHGSAGAERHISVLGGDFGNYLQSDFDDRWTTANPGASKPRTSNRNTEYWRSFDNTYFLYKTDFIRLKNLEFGYSLNPAICSKMGLQGFRAYVSGTNLLTFSPLKDFDPEDNAGSMNGGSGMNYIVPKIVNFGLSVTF